jgi:hypothetical protein
MADTKISALGDGGAAQAADQIPINRAGANFRLNGSSLSGVVNHDATLNYEIEQHRMINDASNLTTELFSASHVNTLIAGVNASKIWKDNVDTSTEGLGDITLSGEQTLNGVLTSNSRVFVVEQADPTQNGIYDTGTPWVRSADLDEGVEFTSGVQARVDNSASTVNGVGYFMLDVPPTVTIGVTALNFARSAPLELGTTAGTAAAGNDARIPTQDENDALAGTGTPTSGNPFLTQDTFDASINQDVRTTASPTFTGLTAGDAFIGTGFGLSPAIFKHKDAATSNQYSVYATSTGKTLLNSSGGSLELRFNDGASATWNGTTFAAASFTGTGTLLTALNAANLGSGKVPSARLTYGALVDTVTQGNDARLSDSRTCDNTFDDADTAKTNLAIAQADVNGLTTSDSPTFAGLTANGDVSLTGSSDLSFSTTFNNRKISLYPGANDHQYLGFGVNSQTLRYQVAAPTDDHVFYSGIDDSSSLELMRIQGGGDGLTVNSSLQSNGLDVVDGNIGILTGADSTSNNRTNATAKVSRIACAHYTNAEEPVAMIQCNSLVGTSELLYGGGSTGVNAATSHQFFTAADNVTSTGGTLSMSIGSDGILALKSQTIAAANADADSIKIFSGELSAGNTQLALRLEGNGALLAGTSITLDRSIAININGTQFYLAASTAAIT